MNTDLMTKLQTIIYSNQDKLELLVEALEDVCNEINTVLAPENPYDDYEVSEKDIGSVFKLWDTPSREGKTPNSILTRLDPTHPRSKYGDATTWWINATPCTDIIKLHFNPYYATTDSEMPSELHSGMCVAILFNEGTIEVTNCPGNYDWGYDGDFQYIVGYQVLQFVNPVLDK